MILPNTKVSLRLTLGAGFIGGGLASGAGIFTKGLRQTVLFTGLRQTVLFTGLMQTVLFTGLMQTVLFTGLTQTVLFTVTAKEGNGGVDPDPGFGAWEGGGGGGGEGVGLKPCGCEGLGSGSGARGERGGGWESKLCEGGEGGGKGLNSVLGA